MTLQLHDLMTVMGSFHYGQGLSIGLLCVIVLIFQLEQMWQPPLTINFLICINFVGLKKWR